MHLLLALISALVLLTPLAGGPAAPVELPVVQAAQTAPAGPIGHPSPLHHAHRVHGRHLGPFTPPLAIDLRLGLSPPRPHWSLTSDDSAALASPAPLEHPPRS